MAKNFNEEVRKKKEMKVREAIRFGYIQRNVTFVEENMIGFILRIRSK